jgi:outer membrane protein TolC
MNDRRRLSYRLTPFVLSLAAGWTGALALEGQQAPPADALTLRHAVELALERAPQLAATRASRDEALAAANISRDALHPSVWASTTPGYSSGLPVSVAGSVPAYASIEVRQTIYDPWRKNEALQAQASAADFEGAVESGCAATVRTVATAYAKASRPPKRRAAGPPRSSAKAA